MMIGARALIRMFGRPMQLKRDGSVIVSFTGRRANIRPESDQIEQSFDQVLYRIIGLSEDFVFGSPLEAVYPQKFDVVVDERGTEYTVQTAHTAGADVDELVKMTVKGGQA